VAKTSYAKAATTGCIFCGRRWTPGIVRKSKEHPLGDWIRQREENHPAVHTSYSTGYLLGEDRSELVQVRPEVTHNKAPLLTVHTREVCQDCNNGWMSAIEQAARPIIVQMARAAQSGPAIAVSRERARELALWAQKTAMAARPSRRLTPADMATAFPGEMDAALALLRRGRVPPDERHHR